MVALQSLLLITLGAGLLAVTWRSFPAGWLPCGPNGLRGRVEVSRKCQPAAYWALVVLYTSMGLWMLRLGVSVMVGTTEPLPLS